MCNHESTFTLNGCRNNVYDSLNATKKKASENVSSNNAKTFNGNLPIDGQTKARAGREKRSRAFTIRSRLLARKKKKKERSNGNPIVMDDSCG